MKVGIITLPGNNYGGTLQAYALKHTIEKLGFEVNHINYNFGGKKSMKDIVKKAVYYNREKKFNKFKKENLGLTRKVNSFEKFEDDYDIYVAGSDQIWNQRIPLSVRKNFYLDFVKDKKKIAYAASVGSDTVEENEKEKISDLLNRLDYISIREKTGVKLYQQLTSKKIENVLDPTLLLTRNEWDSLPSAYDKKENYIFSYTLGADKSVIEKIDEIAEKMNKKIIEISYKRNFKNELRNENNAGPNEFLKLLKNSDYVLTNSFHGMVFSIIYGKDFWVFKRGNMNSRIQDLLDILNLKDRIIDLEEKSDLSDEKLKEKINYDEVYKKLEKEKDKSLKFLKEALGVE